MNDLVQHPSGNTPTGFVQGFTGFLKDTLVKTGIPRLIGGVEVLDKGLAEIAEGLAPLVGELVLVFHRDESLAAAVFDTDNYMHIPRAHGWLRDIYEIRVPAPLVPWVKKVLRAGPPSNAEAMHQWLGRMAFVVPDLPSKSLAKFVLFEMLCLGQRVVLAVEDIDVELLDGQRDHVEQRAEEELREVENRVNLQDALLQVEDPVRVMFSTALARLDGYVAALTESVTWVQENYADALKKRALVLEVTKQMEPADAILLRNKAAHVFDEQRLDVKQLKVLHPGHLGNMDEGALYKRTERLGAKVAKVERRGNETDKPRKKNGHSIMDLIVEAAREGQE